MANNFKIYAADKNYVYADDATYESSTFRTTGGVPNNTASAFAVNTALYCASIITKTLIDAMVANTGVSIDVGITTTEANLITAFGNQLAALTVSKANTWTTARNMSISDADATNTGTPVSVNGSGNATLKLPSTIKAALTGTASNAAKINNKSFDMTYDSNTGTLSITYN